MLRRHLAFWSGETVDRPLVGAYLGGYILQDIYRVAEEGEQLRPEQLVPARFLDLYLRRCQELQRLDHDLIRPLEPPGSVPWLEAILGCPIRVHAQSVWAEPLLPEDQPLESFEPGWCEAWVEAALRFVRALTRAANSSTQPPFGPAGLPVAGPFLRGPADVIAAMIGTKRLCYAFMDDPHEIHRLARTCAEAWMRLSKRISAEIPSWRDGYVLGARWIYAPKPSTYCSEDVVSLISPATYQTFFLPYNQAMADQFAFGFLHRHSNSCQHLTTLLDLQPGWAIEVTMDPAGPSVREILPVFRRIQRQGRPLIVFGLNDEADVRELVTELSPRGLCVIVQADTMEQARQLLSVARGG